MRIFFRGLAVIAVALLAEAALAQKFVTDRFDVRAKIMPNRTVEISEFITVRYTQKQHGLIRSIPARTRSANTTRTVRYSEESASLDGMPTPAVAGYDSGDWKVRMGDGSKWLTGTHTFVFRYRITGALTDFTQDGNRLGDRTEFMWNMLPSQWPTTIPSSTITVDFPKPASQNFAARVLFGPLGERTGVQLESDGSISGRTDLVRAQFATPTRLEYTILRPNKPGWTTTVVLGLPKGTVVPGSAMIEPIEESSSGDDETAKILDDLQKKANPIGAIFPAIPAILAWLFSRKRPEKPMVVRYDPPDGLTAPAAGYLDDDKFDPRDLCAAIITIAQKGHWQLHHVDNRTNLSISNGKKKELLDPLEQAIFRALEPHGPEIESYMVVEGLRPHYANIASEMRDAMDLKGWSPKYASYNGCIGCLIGGISIPVAVFTLPFFGFWAFAGIPLAIIASLLTMKKRSNWDDAGAEVRWQIKGFKEFISRAHQHELNWLTDKDRDQSVFERLLPYAVAFNLVKEWGQAFEGVQFGPSNWFYADSTDVVWSHYWASNIVDDFSNEWSTTIDSAISSAGTGSLFSSGLSGFGSDDSWNSGGGFDGGGSFGDGGSSGDGGGGGGGDSW